MRIDFDSTWKDTTEIYFTALLELLDTPGLPALSDHEPVNCLDQEMQEVARALGDDGDPEEAVNGGIGRAGVKSAAGEKTAAIAGGQARTSAAATVGRVGN